MILILLSIINTGWGRFINSKYSKPTYLLSSSLGIGIGIGIGAEKEVRLISAGAIRELCLLASIILLFYAGSFYT